MQVSAVSFGNVGRRERRRFSIRRAFITPCGATGDWPAYEPRMFGDALQQSSVTAIGR